MVSNEFSPTDLEFLMLYQARRARAIGMAPYATFFDDLAAAYEVIAAQKEIFNVALSLYKDEGRQALDDLKKLLEKAKTITDPYERKLALINAVELVKELESLTDG